MTTTDRRRLFLRADGVYAVPTIEGGEGGAPDPHHATHEAGGTDVVTLAQSQVSGLTSALGGKVDTTDPRLTDARPPTAHHATHEPGGSDALTALDAGSLTIGTVPVARLPATVVPVEGGFAPFLSGAGGGSGQTYATQFGVYQKTGRWVTGSLWVWLTMKGTFSGQVTIFGLPFTSDPNINHYTAVTLMFHGLATPIATLSGYVGPNTSWISLFYTATVPTTTQATALPGSCIGDGTWFMASFAYLTSP